jgi:hypothetical protein
MANEEEAPQADNQQPQPHPNQDSHIKPNGKAEIVSNTDLPLADCIVYDGHLIKTFRACETKYYHFDVQHLISKGKSAAPGFGIVMHTGIEWFRRSKMEGKSWQLSMEFGAAHLIKAYKEHMPPEMLEEVNQDDKRSLNNALRIYEGYCKWVEPIGYKYHHVEVPFALYLGKAPIYSMITGTEQAIEPEVAQVGERDVIYVGIIDGIIEQHGELQSNDLKSTGWARDMEAWLEGFRMEQALLGYVVAAREVLGVDTNMASVHGIWVGKEVQRVTAKTKPLSDYFRAKEIRWSESQIAEWHVNTLRTVNRIQRNLATGVWQMDFGQNCGAFGGCPYRPLCSAEPSYRSRLTELDYEKAIWTPLEDERLQKMEGGD